MQSIAPDTTNGDHAFFAGRKTHASVWRPVAGRGYYYDVGVLGGSNRLLKSHAGAGDG
ncbi:hypothetical protein GCM10011576_03230 [Micromonospora parathelypteridis]|nr:hypothetical protein GCM10011576_03230 [Micromonospora parathelypteridis]